MVTIIEAVTVTTVTGGDGDSDGFQTRFSQT